MHQLGHTAILQNIPEAHQQCMMSSKDSLAIRDKKKWWAVRRELDTSLEVITVPLGGRVLRVPVGGCVLCMCVQCVWRICIWICMYCV